MRGKAGIAGAQHHHAVVQVEPPQDFLGAGEHALVLVAALLRRGDGDELDLGELVLADHAAGVLAGGARFGTEAWRAGGEAQRELALGENFFTHEVRQRHFRGRDEP